MKRSELRQRAVRLLTIAHEEWTLLNKPRNDFRPGWADRWNERAARNRQRQDAAEQMLAKTPQK